MSQSISAARNYSFEFIINVKWGVRGVVEGSGGGVGAKTKIHIHNYNVYISTIKKRGMECPFGTDKRNIHFHSQ